MAGEVARTGAHRAVPDSTVDWGSTGQTLDRNGPAGTRGYSTSPADTGCMAGPRSSWAPNGEAAADSASELAAGTDSVDRMDRTGTVEAETIDHQLLAGHRYRCCPLWTRMAVGPERTHPVSPIRAVVL